MKPNISQEELLSLIESKRKEMVTTATKTGFLSNQTIKMSVELDLLLNQVQKSSIQYN